jgi:hypothetical protein
MNVCGMDITVEGRLIRIGRLAAEKYEFLDDPKEIIDALRACGTRIDLFTFMQSLANPTPQYDYPLDSDNLAALPISSFDYWWTKQINGKTRNMIRRAEKAGVVVREVPFDEALVEGISGIYNESPTRQGKSFTHYMKDIATVGKENGTFLERSVFIAAFAGSGLIGFAKLVSDQHQGQAALMQIVSMIGQRDKAPTNALIAQAVRSCADRAIPYLVYANFAYGKKAPDTLAEFKRHNGFQRIDVPRYYVPLTVIGQAALGMRLHHGLTARVPETVLARLRTVRRFWHNPSIVTARESL